MDVSGEFWGRIDTWAGPPLGTVLLCVGVFLMIKGATKIKILSFLTGCAIGQLASTLLYGSLGEFIPLSEGDFTLAATFGCGVLMFMLVSLLSMAVTAYISLHVMLWIISMVEANGYNVAAGAMGGILVGVSWLINRYLRKNLYLFGSAALGSMIAIYGYLVMNGGVPSQISIKDPTIQLIGLALFLNSILIQRKILKEHNKSKEDREFIKQAEKQQRIDNDKHGRGRFLEPDILTQAAIGEQQQRHRESYNLNQQHRF